MAIEEFTANRFDVEAVQFSQDTAREIEKWVKALNIRSWLDEGVYHAEYQIKGDLIKLKEGDWIFHFEGKFYIAKSDAFDIMFREPIRWEPKLLTTYDGG